MTFVKSLARHQAFISTDEANTSLLCQECGDHLVHYVNEELTPTKILKDGFTCPTNIFHQVGNDRLETHDYDLTCCSYKITEKPSG